MNKVNPERAILLFSCPDHQGIVAEISHFIFTYNGNIISSDQHHDPETNRFFMRVEWDMSRFTLPAHKLDQAFEPLAIKFGMEYQIEYPHVKPRMAIMVSQYQHCLYDLILRNQEGETQADICLVMGNHEQMRQVAEYFGIPFYFTPSLGRPKQDMEAQQLQILKSHNVDVVVLARYMQILSPEFIASYQNRIINIHHSFLPAFVGAKPYHQAFERGVKIVGATSHYVTSDLDQGPIIDQDVIRITHRDQVPDLLVKGRSLEKTVLSRAVKLHLEHRVIVAGNKTIVFE